MHAPPGLSQPYLYAHGWPEVVYGDQPAAGADFSLTNPGREGWRLLAVGFTLVTDANAANRYVEVAYDDGSGIVYCRNIFSQAVTASTTARFSFQASRGASDWNANNDAALPLLPVSFGRGHKVLITVTNKQAGDQLSRIALVFERYPDVAPEFASELRRD